MNEKQQILKVVKEKPKHYGVIIKNNKDLWQWVLANSTTTLTNTAAQIFSAISNTDEKCAKGKSKRFISFSAGWGGCGTASECECVKQTVSKKVTKAKASRTKIQIDDENKKREKTNLLRHGVSNSGQTLEAKKAHSYFYSDENNVQNQVSKQESTILLRYGVKNIANYAPSQKKKEKTLIKKYGVDNPMKNTTIATKSSKTRLANYDPVELFQKNYHKFVSMVQDIYEVRPLITQQEYSGVARRPKMKFSCCECGDIFEKRFDYGAPPICKICHPTEVRYESGEEIQVREFIQSIYSGPIRVRDRSIINPFELDIVLPEKKIAIEYCGLYWHSELSRKKSWNYHATKYKLALQQGYRLITIFSDEWLKKQSIVKSKLTAILGNRVDTIGARKCRVEQVNYKIALAFHNEHHIQGSPTRLGTNVGVYYQDQLVALASFVGTGEKNELVRYSSSRLVMGACGKIINYFRKNISNLPIVSFADLRWSQGDMYRALNFVEVSRVPPMQSYVLNYSERFHKRAFRKNKINPGNLDKTEWQIMQELGYDRIWDCGKIKFELA